MVQTSTSHTEKKRRGESGQGNWRGLLKGTRAVCYLEQKLVPVRGNAGNILEPLPPTGAKASGSSKKRKKQKNAGLSGKGRGVPMWGESISNMPVSRVSCQMFGQNPKKIQILCGGQANTVNRRRGALGGLGESTQVSIPPGTKNYKGNAPSERFFNRSTAL